MPSAPRRLPQPAQARPAAPPSAAGRWRNAGRTARHGRRASTIGDVLIGRGRDQREGRDAERYAPAERQAARGGNADANAGATCSGPQPTAMRPTARRGQFRAIIGTSRSAWPRPTSWWASASRVPSAAISATEQASVAVSMARSTSCPSLDAAAAGAGSLSAGFRPREPRSLGHVMLEQPFDPLLRGCGRGGAARAGAVHARDRPCRCRSRDRRYRRRHGHRGAHRVSDQLADLRDDSASSGSSANSSSAGT